MAKASTRKIIVRVIIILFLISSALTSLIYLFQTPVVDDVLDSDVDIQAYVEPGIEVVVPDGTTVDVNNPEDNDLQVVVLEDDTRTEMDQVVEVLLEDGSIDTPTVADFSDSLQVSQ
ncbi:MAG: hypothetical protein PHU61_02115 [Candidatus Absconditabacteria bacterium]|nr:hypothetical protein [Candidatus Absconditabacteria bacterium]MDD3868776.1 hypothetical protein [Candidatus Absconditabacteria bacterium]MDD4713921.1 hypothetical protein [Candidatus Absconditabacteria bacterium]